MELSSTVPTRVVKTVIQRFMQPGAPLQSSLGWVAHTPSLTSGPLGKPDLFHSRFKEIWDGCYAQYFVICQSKIEQNLQPTYTNTIFKHRLASFIYDLKTLL